MVGKTQPLEVRVRSRNNAHHHSAATSLDKDIDPEPCHSRQGIRNIAIALLPQHADCCLVVADKIRCNATRIIGAERKHSVRVEGNELAADLYLELAPGRED